jgi:uncharacterized protein YaeQ
MINKLIFDYLVFEKGYEDPKIESLDKVGEETYEVKFVCEKKSHSEKIFLLELLGFMYHVSNKRHFTKTKNKETNEDRWKRELKSDDWLKYSKTDRDFSGLLDNPY